MVILLNGYIVEWLYCLKTIQHFNKTIQQYRHPTIQQFNHFRFYEF
jgi:hypothetical protein